MAATLPLLAHLALLAASPAPREPEVSGAGSAVFPTAELTLRALPRPSAGEVALSAAHTPRGSAFATAHAERAYSTDGWRPAHTCFLDARTLCVIGATRATDTERQQVVVELWIFAPEELERTLVRRVLRVRACGRGLVRASAPHLDAPRPAVLVLFDGTRDLWSLDVATGALALAAASAGGLDDALLAPALATRPWRSIAARRFADGSPAWILRTGEDLVGPDTPVLVLRDRDADGRLDESELLDARVWSARGYGRATSWRH